MDRGTVLQCRSSSRSYSGPLEILPGLEHSGTSKKNTRTYPTIAAVQLRCACARPEFSRVNYCRSSVLASFKIVIQYVTQFKKFTRPHLSLKSESSSSPTAIPEHLLLLLVAAAVGAPGTIPTPFRVDLGLLLLFEHSERAAHPHSHGWGPLLASLALLA